tara:strand:- start:86 stop:244 length:159 start_codon:yes stop_codon:yes gene_type:complete
MGYTEDTYHDVPLSRETYGDIDLNLQGGTVSRVDINGRSLLTIHRYKDIKTG